MKVALILALGAAAIATPALARGHGEGKRQGNMGHGEEMRYRHANMHMGCAKWKHGRCMRRGNAYAYGHNRGNGDYNVGYRFGPSYAYTPYDQIPQPYVTRYSLNRDGRYVYRDNRVYVVNPNTYAVERVLDAISR